MPTQQKEPGGRAARDAAARVRRAADALRANLARRKAQSRARKPADNLPEPGKAAE